MLWPFDPLRLYPWEKIELIYYIIHGYIYTQIFPHAYLQGWNEASGNVPGPKMNHMHA